MRALLSGRRCGPIGVDLGSRSVKLVQLDADGQRLHEASRWDLPHGAKATGDDQVALLADAIGKAREGRRFSGRDAVVCLSARELFVQNLRVPRLSGEALEKTVLQEAAGRLPFAAGEAEVRFIEADDVKQGDTTKREIIVLACHRPVLQRLLATIEQAGLRPVAIDIEPSALARCYSKQFRRDQDRDQRAMFVQVGSSKTAVVIARGENTLFIKYIDVGGRQFDEAVARKLKMSLADATALRRHNGDRRADQQDPEIMRSVAESVRPVLDRLAGELAMCIRYHSVTFRGQPLSRVVVGGGEASTGLLEALSERLDMKCELGDPLRSFEASSACGRKTQWDVATGLALRQAT